jgi:hypothetical protein
MTLVSECRGELRGNGWGDTSESVELETLYVQGILSNYIDKIH